jgi:hypothetical protein
MVSLFYPNSDRLSNDALEVHLPDGVELTGRGLPHETVAGEQARGFAVTLPVSTPTC